MDNPLVSIEKKKELLKEAIKYVKIITHTKHICLLFNSLFLSHSLSLSTSLGIRNSISLKP